MASTPVIIINKGDVEAQALHTGQPPGEGGFSAFVLVGKGGRPLQVAPGSHESVKKWGSNSLHNTVKDEDFFELMPSYDVR